jgi:hypothetical protein
MRTMLMALVLSVAAVVVAVWPAGALYASQGPSVEWQPTGFTGQATALFTPASGAFFAKTEAGISRSDNGGANWRSVSVPPGFPGAVWPSVPVAIDSSDHTRMFVGGWATRDDAATWNAVGPWTGDPEASVLLTEPSGADGQLLFLVAKKNKDLSVHRSRDGGGTWDTTLNLGAGDFAPGASIGVTLFAAHPTDPSVLFQSVVGFRGRGNQGVLRRSSDQGQTFAAVLSNPLHMPSRLVGGRGPTAGRFYVMMSSEEANQVLYRSDDGGVTWIEAGSFGSASSLVEVRGLTYDPSMPDRVWVALEPGGVKASEDGGQTWTDLGPVNGPINDLALGVDGANLYAATTSGIVRLALR